jgi:hypothetical protein
VAATSHWDAPTISAQYEPILYGWKHGIDHYWCGARDQGDVWFIDKPAKNDLHPTMKPVELVERAIRNSSKSRDIVLDPFGGSGTTVIAAERAGRSAPFGRTRPQSSSNVGRTRRGNPRCSVPPARVSLNWLQRTLRPHNSLPGDCPGYATAA